MTEENMPASEEHPETHSTLEPAVSAGEMTLPEAPADQAEPVTSDADDQLASLSKDAEPLPSEADDQLASLSQDAEAETETPKPAKKPRKSSKVAAAEKENEPTPAKALDGPAGEASPDHTKKWYVVKVQSGREDSIKAAIERKVKIEGLEEFFGQIAIPVEEIIQKKSIRVTDKKTGDKVTQEKKVVKHQKKFPGYLFAEVEYNDRILYLFRDTSGVGDFVGASLHREPTPMTDREVRAMLTGVVEGDPGKPMKQKVKLDYEKGDKVKIRDGAFANMEGIVKSITDTKDSGETPKVKVEVTIFGRPVEVDLDYWHVDKA